MTEHIGINVIISRAVEVLRSDKIFGPRLSNTWLPVATFAEAIMKSGHVDATLIIDAREFNVAMSKSNQWHKSNWSVSSKVVCLAIFLLLY